MNRRPRRRRSFRWVDALIGLALFAVMIGAIIRWPDKTVADVAFPTAFLIAAVLTFEGAEFNPDQIAAHAEAFHNKRFTTRMTEQIESYLQLAIARANHLRRAWQYNSSGIPHITGLDALDGQPFNPKLCTRPRLSVPIRARS